MKAKSRSERHTKVVRHMAIFSVIAASAIILVGAYQLGRETASEPQSATHDASHTPKNATKVSAPPTGVTGMIHGWGAQQPHLMYAKVVGGKTGEPVTVAQHEALGAVIVRVQRAAMSIGTVREAERLGYVKNNEWVNGRGYEYINWSRWRKELDLDEPTMLLFPDDKPDSRLISVAYQVLGSEAAGPPAGLDTSIIPWHLHDSMCWKAGQIVGANKPERCAQLGGVIRNDLTHWMVDFWVIPGWENPWGLVSSFHPDLFASPVPWFCVDADPMESPISSRPFLACPPGSEVAPGSGRGAPGN